MLIRLKIDNVERLPDGRPLTYISRDRGFEIGREGRDWVLPDPDMFISGRHCEVRFDRGAFWLCDVSRNGTFVNGGAERLAAPHRLSHGDQLRIGRYTVSVSIEAEPVAPSRNPGLSLAAEPFVSAQPGPGPAAPSAPARQFQRLEVPPGAPYPAAPASSRTPTADDILRAIAAGAGVPPETFQGRDPAELAAEIGGVLKIMAEELSSLLKARASAKVLARSSQRTMIGAADNNPLKFVPAAAEMLDIMFGGRRSGYLDARRSVGEAFRDLQTHEIATYAAMQAALARLLDDLSPETIEKKLAASGFSSRKSRAWDAFVASWEAREQSHENGMLDVFLAYFSEAYAKAAKPK
ncbi:MAG: type VI secretion system-associated FHA domain protein TagH [Mesorhizobium sp.]